jgi:hypothetical protein
MVLLVMVLSGGTAIHAQGVTHHDHIGILFTHPLQLLGTAQPHPLLTGHLPALQLHMWRGLQIQWARHVQFPCFTLIASLIQWWL